MVHSLAVILHVPQCGGQGDMDDSQLDIWSVQQLSEVQLESQHGKAQTHTSHIAGAFLPPPGMARGEGDTRLLLVSL